MINPKLITFLRNIAKHNNKRWYDEHKDEYKILRQEFTQQLEVIRDNLAKIDPAIGRGLKNNARTMKVFRLHRDTRFSRNKQKYKTNISGLIAADVKNPTEPAYYFSIEPGGKSFIGGGIYLPESDHLKRIREYIARGKNHEKLSSLLSDKKIARVFPAGLGDSFMLKTAPQGFPKDHPAIALLRYKSFTLGKGLPDAELKNPQLQKELTKQLAALYPLNDFLRKAGK